jgi:hypothetical protein
VASDGGGANGLYTQHLLAAIRQPGNKIEDVFKQVRANVRRDSQGKQVPWESTSLEGDFYFRGAPAAIAAPDPGMALDSALWDAVKGSNLAIEIRAYLNRYPNGKFAAEARSRLTQLKPVAAVPVTTASTLQGAPASASSAALPAVKVNAASNAISHGGVTANSATPSVDDQAAVDRRTKELMTDLAAAPTVAVARPTRTPPASNGSGFTVGDRWRYQTVDKVKMEVVNNWSRVVEGLNNDGKLNGGKVTWTGDGSVKTIRSENGTTRDFSPAYKWLPSTLKAGYSEPVKLTLAWQNANGNKGTERRHGTVQVMGSETIKVPAGEFEAWKIEFSGYSEGQNESKNKTYTHRFKEISWYVPAVHNYVAIENLTTDSKNRIVFYERQELTSYSVRGADRVAQK